MEVFLGFWIFFRFPFPIYLLHHCVMVISLNTVVYDLGASTKPYNDYSGED